MALDRTELKIYSNTGTEEEKRYANAIIPVSHCDVRRVAFFLSIWQRTVCVCVCVCNEPPPLQPLIMRRNPWRVPAERLDEVSDR